MLLKSIVFLSLLLVQFSSGLECYDCSESSTDKGNSKVGGSCFSPDDSTRNSLDCVYCLAKTKLDEKGDSIERSCIKSGNITSGIKALNGKCSIDPEDKRNQICVCRNKNLCMPENQPFVTVPARQADKQLDNNSKISGTTSSRKNTTPKSGSSTNFLSLTSLLFGLILFGNY